ncbi:metallophosphoesterase [Deinococcus irradiatisoli]|uniref:metallophosphoesterase n=1 Tax=Deinococcus irradiatisoli TaxID=2202254 RepID=UPI0015E86A52|nr:metallophosphoesterase [Deinococcus irradiatisoli]
MQLSDVHGRTRFLNGCLARKVNALNPDVVCVTGDLVNRRADLPRVLAELGRIRCSRKYFVPGNWERETQQGLGKRLTTPEETAATLRAVSPVARVLLNQGEVITLGGRKVLIYGFDNSLEDLAAYRPPGEAAEVRVLLAHSPLIIGLLRREQVPFDLLLTGDTHGGQLRVLGFTRRDVQHWHVGAKTEAGGGVFVISRGLGTVKVPLRLGSPPEIVCADLWPAG